MQKNYLFLLIFVTFLIIYLFLPKKKIIENWNPNFLSVDTNTSLFNYFFY